ncbi:hypothetical protein [Cupriavidus pauculus]|nr:hypothetical protein [Cupriavidus pauculus]
MPAKLGPLSIYSTISPCNTAVFLHGQVIGATVTLGVTRAGVPLAGDVGHGVASWPDGTIGLAIALAPGDWITARQSLAGFTDSDPAPVVQVQAWPSDADLHTGSFTRPIYACAQCIELQGLFPLAELVISGSQGPLGRSVVGADGMAHVDLDRELRSADLPLQATQTACNGTRATLTDSLREFVAQLPVPLPQPSAQLPARCSPVVLCSGLTPGAKVIISRGAQAWVACAGRPSTPIRIPPLAPPVPGDNTLQVQEVFDACGIKSYPPVDVPILDGPPMPVATAPLCTGQPLVLTQLQPGALVEVTLPDGQVFVFSAGAATQPFNVPPLIPGLLQVRQNLCGQANSWSATALIGVGDRVPSAPELISPVPHAVGVDLRGPLQWQPGVATPCNQTSTFRLQVTADKRLTDAKQADGLTFNAKDGNYDIPNIVPLHWWYFYKPGNLKGNTVYYWRVAGQFIGNAGWQTGPWSAVHQFTTAAESATTPAGAPPNQPQQTAFQFIEDCCGNGNYRRVVVASGTSLADAQAKVEQQAPGCDVRPYDGFSPVPPCSAP